MFVLYCFDDNGTVNDVNEFNSIVGVYSTAEKAEAAMVVCATVDNRDEMFRYNYFIEEFELDNMDV